MLASKNTFTRPLRLRWNRPVNLLDTRLILTGLRYLSDPSPDGATYNGAHLIIVTDTDVQTIEPRLGDTFHAAGSKWYLHTALPLPNGEPIADLVPKHSPVHRRLSRP